MSDGRDPDDRRKRRPRRRRARTKPPGARRADEPAADSPVERAPVEPAPGDTKRGREREPGAGRRGSRTRAGSGRGDAGAGAAGGAARRTWRGLQLLEFQEEAVAAFEAGSNLLVGAPTGAGKTLVAEIAMETALARGRRAIYTAPIKALSNQKFRDFRATPGADVGLLTGDVTIQPGAQLLIMTTEILRNTILEDPARLHDVDVVVFDEVHYMDDPDRGTVWEECLIFAPPPMRFVCLSATISNIDELGGWIRSVREHGLHVVTSVERPVPLAHRLYHPRLGSIEARELERKRRWARKAGKPLLPRPRRAKGRGPGGRGRGGRPFRSPADRDGPTLALLDDIEERGLLPALVFAFSRRDCERLARANLKRDLLDEEERGRMRGLQDELIETFQLDRQFLRGELMTMALHGIGYHHAGVLPIHKEIVERLFASGLLKLLMTTETFALGINMPARSVVFHSLRKFDGEKVDFLRTREYMQMAGRAGRQGLDESGHVFAVLGDRDLDDAPVERLIRGEPEPVESRFRLSYSTILHLLEHLGRERLIVAWEKSFRNFRLREETPKARKRHLRKQLALVDAHVEFLKDLGYVEPDDTLTPRGRIARKLNAFELSITELLQSGVLEQETPRSLAVVFAGLVYEERRRFAEDGPPPSLLGDLRRGVDRVVRRLSAREAAFGIPSAVKAPDWGLTEGVLAWYDGAPIEEVEEHVGVPGGDFCRTLRMTLQLMRQVRHSIDREWDLHDRLGEAIRAVCRDEVDPRLQLELGDPIHDLELSSTDAADS